MEPEMTKEEFIKLGQAAEDAKRKFLGLFEDADGNWRGVLITGEKTVFARAIGPDTVLQQLLTNDA